MTEHRKQRVYRKKNIFFEVLRRSIPTDPTMFKPPIFCGFPPATDTARGSLPRTSWRTSRRIRLPYTLPAGSTPAKIWPQCCANAPRTSRHRSRWAMRCRATCTRRPTRCWRIVWPMADVSSRRWPRVSPGECRDVLEALREVYRFDAEAKERGLSPAPRLVHHQTHRPVGDGPPQGVDAGKI